MDLNKKESYKIFDNIYLQYDRLNYIISLCMHQLWRRKFLSNIPKEKALDYLDIATGTGSVLFYLLESRTNIQKAMGLDMSEKMLSIAKLRGEELNLLSKLSFEKQDACNMKLPKESFDIITISFGIRNMHDLNSVLKSCNQFLRPNGKLMIMELGVPRNPFLKKLHTCYLSVLPRFANFFIRNKKAYDYLVSSIQKFDNPNDLMEMMKKTSFTNIQHESIHCGVVNFFIAEKK